MAKVSDSVKKNSGRALGAPRQPSGWSPLYTAVAFLAALSVLCIILSQAESLVRLGLVGNIYYVLLVPLGLAVSAFLFGVLRSYAAYAGKVYGGSIELGGPIVAFALVLVLGFYLIPNARPFALTIFVHGEAGPQDLLLRNIGSVLIDLGGDRRRELIGDRGQAFFPGIPPTFRGQWIFATIADADGYEPVASNSRIRVEDDGAYLAIRPKAAELVGYVRSETGQPIAGARVSVAGLSAQTDSSGFFKLILPRAAPLSNLSMQVSATGFLAWNSHVIPGANDIAVVLDYSGVPARPTIASRPR